METDSNTNLKQQIELYTSQLQNFVSFQDMFEVKEAFNVNHTRIHFAEIMIS